MALGGPRPLSPERVGMGGLSADAYHLYLRGRFHRNQWTLGGFEKSVEYFERALSLAPDSAQILAALSEAETLRAIEGHIPAAPHLGGARSAAERAIALDSRCAQAHLSLGWVHHIHDWDWGSGQAEFDRALEVNPSFAEASHLKGLFLALRQRIAEAEECFKRAIESDPLSLVIQTHTALVPYFAGKFDEAVSRAQAALVAKRLKADYPAATCALENETSDNAEHLSRCDDFLTKFCHCSAKATCASRGARGRQGNASGIDPAARRCAQYRAASLFIAETPDRA